MEVLGYIFGLSAMSFAIIAWTQIASLGKELEELRKELEELRKKLKDSGALE